MASANTGGTIATTSATDASPQQMKKRTRPTKEGTVSSKPLTVKPIPIPHNYKHPPAPHPALPNHEFSMGIIAPKGSGKTTLLCNLLKFYSGYFHSIIVFSPTVNSGEIPMMEALSWFCIMMSVLRASILTLRSSASGIHCRLYSMLLV